MGINHEAPEQTNVLGKWNLVHYLWVDVAIYEMYFRYPNLYPIKLKINPNLYWFYIREYPL